VTWSIRTTNGLFRRQWKTRSPPFSTGARAGSQQLLSSWTASGLGAVLSDSHRTPHCCFCGERGEILGRYSRSPKNPALQLLQKSSKSASTTPQRPIWNTFGTVAVRDFWENDCSSSCRATKLRRNKMRQSPCYDADGWRMSTCLLWQGAMWVDWASALPRGREKGVWPEAMSSRYSMSVCCRRHLRCTSYNPVC